MAFNLKAVFSADTKGIKQGSKEAQEAIKEFDKTTESAIDSVAGLFGTSMSQISSTLNSIKGGFMALDRGINGTAAATSGLSKAMKVLKITLASTGIGALVVAFGSLVAYFTQTQRGADALSQTMATVGQVFKTLTDYAIKLGEKIVNAFKNPGKAIKEFFNSEKNIASTIGSIFDDVNDKVKRRKELTSQYQALEKQNIDWIVEQAELQMQIEQQREIAADKANRTNEERLAANKKALALTARLYAKQEELERKKLELIQEENALSESMNKDLQAEAEQRVKILNVEKERASRSKELLSQQSELTNLVNKELEAKQKMKDLADRKKKDLTLEVVSDEKIKDLVPKTVTTTYKTEIDVESMRKVKKEMEEFSFDIESTMEGMINGVAQSMGEMIAGLITGEAKITDLFGAVASMIGQALQQIGGALVAYGVSMEAFKKAFNNPYAAIAAGVALQAAGAALASLVQRSFGSSGSMGSSYGNMINAGSTVTIGQTSALQNTQQELNVNVSGQLTAKGSTLVAIIENEDKRKQRSS